MYMRFFSVAEARAKFAQIIQSSEQTHERIVITRNGEPAVIMLSVDDYEGMVDQIEILSDPELLKELKASVAEFEKHPESVVTADSAAMQKLISERKDSSDSV